MCHILGAISIKEPLVSMQPREFSFISYYSCHGMETVHIGYGILMYEEKSTIVHASLQLF